MAEQAETQTIEIDGVTLKGSPEYLEKILGKLNIQSRAEPSEPKPKAKKPGAPTRRGSTPKKWTHEETLAEMEKDLPAAIMKVVAQQLGVSSVSAYLENMSGGINTTYGVAQENLISSTLRANNVAPTAEAIEDFRNILDEKPTDKQAPTFANFDAITKDAIGKKWFSVTEKSPEKSETGDVITKPVDKTVAPVKEPLIPARGREQGVVEKAGATDDGGSSEADLEAAMKDDPQNFLQKLHAAHREVVQ